MRASLPAITHSLLAAGFALCLAQGLSAQTTPYLHAPSINDYAKHDPDGVTILPTGRFIKPVGQHLPLSRWPHGLTLSPDGATAFVASDGVGQFITDWNSPHPNVATFTLSPTGAPRRRTNAGGAAFSRDGKTLYWSSGESGEVFAVNVETRTVTAEIPLNVEVNGKKYDDSFGMDVKLSEDGASLYVADVTNFRVAIIDLRNNKVVGSVGVGRYPYALAVTGKQVYVANIGVFAYSPIPSPTLPAKEGEKIDPRGLTFPPFGFPSQESRDGVEVEGRQVPGLGAPNVPESFSVWGIDVSDPAQPKVTHRIKTGLLMGAPADNGKTIGGSAPNFLAASGNALYVSNGNNDSIERIDLTSGKINQKTRIIPSPLTAKLRGVGPSGMVVSPDGGRVYVAESGLNAIGVLDTHTGKMLGHIPTAWYPYRVALSQDGKKLLCICFRGFGNGPNAGENRPNSPYLGMRGSLHIMDVPTDADLAEMTQNVLTYNGMVDKSADRAQMSTPLIPALPGKPSEQIKYVVFITKENHTYDTIFDHIPGANDDPKLLRWGFHQKIAASGQPDLSDAAVMTNHNALARQFTVSDNFYMEPEASGVGHRWLVGVQPDNFCQMLYTLGWNFKVNSTAPGRRASFGSNGSIAPEDYPEAGSMWEHLARFNVSFRNYGEGFEFAGVGEDEDEFRTGAREVINMPMSKVLYDNTCREFPIFNMNIPDQYRAYWFQKDFTKLFLDTKKPAPHFINIAICNDHGTGPQPKRGYPYVASWMADNDLALGRIVEFLSHTPYWKNMAIFVTQDDSGGEPDHIDAQRSVLLVISPWVKHGYVSHRQTTIVSMHRTLYEILGLPALNMFDGLANDFSDCFTTTPDYTPYKVTPVDARIFDPEKAKDPKDPDYKVARTRPSIRRDDEEEEERVLRGDK
ncbi:MAG TPA: bifunctional YncE family protein/alkaline phosphatase family protein [Chthonomonadaceae bacterium]|nr:bifunctional YncE family protein/alkaline phosphatase family protein [Chthonomonadaceae bacterium]